MFDPSLEVLMMETQEQCDKNYVKFGEQPLSKLLVVLMEEVGEIARAHLEGDHKNYKVEIVQTVAVLVEMYRMAEGYEKT